MSHNTTLTYYAAHAQDFYDTTVNVPFAATQQRFLEKLPARARILDFGCGSGRDTKYFLGRGYQVEATDGSAELCRLASVYTGANVKHFFTLLGKMFFTPYGKEFFTYLGKQIFTS